MPTSRVKNRRNGRLRRRYLARRLEILRAAGREFRIRGFAETGMRDIAEAAELSPANLYNYFHGKHDLLFFCQDNALDRLTGALDRVRSMRSSAAAKLRLVIFSHLRCLLDEVEGSAAHLLTSALPERRQRNLLAKRDGYEKGVRNLIASGIRTGEFTPCDPALTTRAVLGALNWSVQWFNPDGPLTTDEIAEGIADYLIRGLLASPAELRQQSFLRERAQSSRSRKMESPQRSRPKHQAMIRRGEAT